MASPNFETIKTAVLSENGQWKKLLSVVMIEKKGFLDIRSFHGTQATKNGVFLCPKEFLFLCDWFESGNGNDCLTFQGRIVTIKKEGYLTTITLSTPRKESRLKVNKAEIINLLKTAEDMLKVLLPEKDKDENFLKYFNL